MSKYFLSRPDGSTVHSTLEQESIIEAAINTRDSLLLNALAGAAKTSTLEMICKYHPVIPILYVVFNKRNQEEAKKKLPGHVDCKTANALGHRVWANATGKRLVLDKDKVYNLLKEAASSITRSEKEEYYETFTDTLKLIKAAKLQGYVPQGIPAQRSLLTQEEFYADRDEGEVTPLQRRLVDDILRSSITAAYAGAIDFYDQLYMPTLFGGAFPKFPLVLVDEAQDLSPLNHAMLEKLVTGRLIAVGDPWQSIYAFRGAVFNGMSRLRERFNLRDMNLSVSFRVPKAGVIRARARAPHMQWWENASEGLVEDLESWSAKSIPDNAAIICRYNAPLFRCALELIKQGRGVQLIGRDIGPGLIRTLKKLGNSTLTKEETLNAIERWRVEQLKKSKAKASIHDRAECLRIFAEFGGSLGGAIAYAEHLFSTSGPIQLLSGHKAKGLEWDVVYHLDPQLIPSVYAETPEELDQELNVQYVIETRFKRELYLVTSDGLHA